MSNLDHRDFKCIKMDEFSEIILDRYEWHAWHVLAMLFESILQYQCLFQLPQPNFVDNFILNEELWIFRYIFTEFIVSFIKNGPSK